MRRLKKSMRRREAHCSLVRVRRRGEEVLEKEEKRRAHFEKKGAQEEEGAP
jgi:hypothetical protein